MLRLMIWLFITVVGLSGSVCYSASLYPDTYDKEFKRAALHLPAGTDWRLLKAQCWQESRLKRNAVSPVGAMGLCQFMPGTWQDMQAAYPELSDPWLPVQSIRAAALYMRRLNATWSSPRPQTDRYMLTLASYNAGLGHIINAQRACNMRLLYDDIVPPCLPGITGHHSRETISYVDLIVNKWWPSMRRL